MCKRQIYYITLLIFTIILAFGCTDTDPFSGEGDLSGDCEGAFVNLAFKMPSLPEVELRAAVKGEGLFRSHMLAFVPAGTG